MNLVGQIIGFFGIGLNFFIFQQKDRKKLLMFKLISDFVWAAHYFMLNAYAGFAVAAIGVFRELVSYNKEKRNGFFEKIAKNFSKPLDKRHFG